MTLCRTPLLGGSPGARLQRLLSRCGARRLQTRGFDAGGRAGPRLSYAPYDSWANRIAVHRFVQDIPLKAGDAAYEIVSGVDAGLERFRRTPMLICWGEQDFVFDRHFLDEWRRRFPEAEVHSFVDAGHYILEDCREELVPLDPSPS